METGTIIKSSQFNVKPYWVIKCDNPNLPGNKNGQLPIDPLTHYMPYYNFLGRLWKIDERVGRKVEFNVIKVGSENSPIQYYAELNNGRRQF